jgi:hypothetical protein
MVNKVTHRTGPVRRLALCAVMLLVTTVIVDQATRSTA